LKLVILNPVRTGVSGGFVKFIREVVTRWSRNNIIERISIVSPEAVVEGAENLDVDFHFVSRDDYRTGFREMARRAEAGNYDVALCTTARPVKLQGCPIVTMVQNIEPIQRPVYHMPFAWRMRLWSLRWETAIACRQATRVLAISDHAKQEVCRRFGIQPDIVDVVYFGFDPNESASPRKPDIGVPEDDFIFSAGSIVPYRGYEDIIRALTRFRSDSPRIPFVVLAGTGVAYARSYKKQLQRLASSLGVENRIAWAGQLTRDEMAWCYRNAKLFVQTSRAEACPNIVLEAMGNGCLCVSCDHSPMPEIFHDAALFYPIGDAGALAARIKMALEMDTNEAESWRMRGLQRATFFSWDKTADQTLEVLQRAIKEHRK
jgi:glycosyltransferase involved in cell wall biosynthesis